MENIDDLMRQKFDSDDPGERFEFQEEYWAQAQALLEREEERRRRWLWLFIGLWLAIALLAWFLIDQSGILSQNKTGIGDSTTSTEKTEKQINLEGAPTLGEQETKAEAGGQISSDRKEKHGSAITEAQASNKKTSPLSQGNATYKSKNSNSKSQASDPKTRNKYKSWKGLDQRNSSETAVETSNLSEGTVTTGEAASSLLNTDPSQQSRNLQKQAGRPQDAIDERTKNELNSKDIPVTNQPINQLTNQPINQSTNQPINQSTNQPITNLPTPLTPFPIPTRDVAPKKVPVPLKEPIANTPNPVSDKRFSFGLSMAGAAYQKTESTDKWAGWVLGAFGDYRLNKNWSLMLGAQWRFLPGHAAGEDSLNPVSVEQLRYSFGYKNELWQRETRGLHYLEIPFSVRWQKDRWGLEGGGAVGRLLAVQNQTKHTVSSSLEPTKTTITKFVKGNTQPYNQVNFSAFAGVAYRLNNRLSLTSRVQYRFTPVFKPDIERVKNKGFGHVEVGLRVRLF